MYDCFLIIHLDGNLIIMGEVTICDYSDYDYKSEFWTNQNRQYEHLLELDVINRLLKQYVHQKRSIH